MSSVSKQAIRRIFKMSHHILQALPTTVDGHFPVSRDPDLSEPHTIRHVYFHTRAFKSSFQVRNVFLMSTEMST